MEKFYHVDRFNRLTTEDKITISSDTPSTFGNIYLDQFEKYKLDLNTPLENTPFAVSFLSKAAYREYYLEIVRRGHPSLKSVSTYSRLSAFFALDSYEDAIRFMERTAESEGNRLFEVFTEGPFLKLDMTWLDQGFPRDIRKFGYYYEHYWKGNKIENDEYLKDHEKRGSLIEVLILGPVTIGKELQIIT